jgi:hypothetical protein
MKKRSLIFGVAMLMGLAVIFSGCETETTTETKTVNNGAAGDLDGLKKLLATDGVNEVAYYGDLEISDETLVIPAGKTVTMKDGGVTLSTGLLVVVGTLTLPDGKSIEVSSTGTVAGSDALLESVVGDNAVKAKLASSIDGVATNSAVALKDFTLPASYPADFAGTAYVYDTLTVASASTAPSSGKIVAIVKVSISGTTTALSDASKVDVSGATLVTSAEADVTLPTDAVVVAIDATEGGFTLVGAGTLTVGKLSGNLKLPATVTDVSISGGNGNVTLVGTESERTFTTAATFGNTGTTTFDATGTGAVTFKPVTSFGGAVVFSSPVTFDNTVTFAGDVTAAAGKDITATKQITNNGTFTLGADGSLLLKSAADGDAKLTGTGKLVAASTEIEGVWAGSVAGSLTITAKAGGTESIIAGSESVFKAGEGGVITQKAGEGNNLTIAGSTTVALGATPEGAALGKIILTGDEANGGKITLAGTDAVISGSIGASTDVSVAAGSVTIIGVDTVSAGSISGGTLSSESKTLGFLAGSESTTKNALVASGTESVYIDATTVIISD